MPDDDRESLPRTEPTSAPIFDTGPHPQPLEPYLQAADPAPSKPIPAAELETPNPSQPSAAETPPSEPLPVPARSIAVPGHYYYYLKWWRLVMVLIGVWIPAALIGLGLYYYWVDNHSPHKTLPDFTVLIYVVVCTVGGLMLAMVRHKPLVSALAIALISAPFASVVAAAPLYGIYYCDHATQVNPATRCLAGMIPY